MAAAYAALTSLKQIIDKLQHHPSPPISLDKAHAGSLSENVTFLQKFLEAYDSPFCHSNEADPLEMRIAGAAYAAEDIIESHIVDAIQLARSSKFIGETNQLTKMLRGLDKPNNHSQEETSSAGSKNQRMKMRFQGLKKPNNHSEEKNSSVGSISQRIKMSLNCFQGPQKPINHTSPKKPENEGQKVYQDLHKVTKEMDLLKKEVMEIITEPTAVRAQLQRNVVSGSSSTEQSNIIVGFDDVSIEIMDKLTDDRLDRQVIPIVGMAGIGKTTLSRHVYRRPFTKQHFDIRAWATISPHYNINEILCEILSQANKKTKEELNHMSEDELGLALYQYLSCRRFLIVMDDMWNIEPWEKIERFFPENYNGSRIVVTTRLLKLGSQLSSSNVHEMRFLDEASSWKLLAKIVFGKRSCPLELDKIGKKIAKNCRGLPLSIVVVGGLLQKLEHAQECWESIQNNLNSVVNSEDEGFCLKVLKMSYNHLPVYLKSCFLYMGVFEEDCAIRVSTLIKLWVSEGFLEPVRDKSLETVAKEYLKDLINRNLVLVDELGATGNVKFCKIHDLLRDLCCREAAKEGFFHVIGKHNFQSLNSQRRVVIPGSTSKEEVLGSLQSMPFACSFICGNKEVQLFPKSRLLRTLKAFDRDSLGSHDYLLDDLFQFVNSRYLAVGVHRESKLIDSSINLLWNLQTLIICHSYLVLPIIFEMPQLRHVEFHKGVLDRLCLRGHIVMENLQTLKGVSFDRISSCTESYLIPNIKKLGITDGKIPWILKYLSKLESFRCWNMVNHDDDMSNFPNSLKKLSLGSYTTEWEDMENMLEKIGALPLLEKLKLERFHFQECKWETIEDQFPSLKFLQLKWCRLKSWTSEASHFPRLEKLHLYGLKLLDEIPSEIGEIPTMQSILLEYCSQSVMESAKAIAEEEEELQVRIVIFNNHNNQALRSLASPNFQVEMTDF